MAYDDLPNSGEESYGNTVRTEYMKIVDSGLKLAGEGSRKAINQFKELFR